MRVYTSALLSLILGAANMQADEPKKDEPKTGPLKLKRKEDFDLKVRVSGQGLETVAARTEIKGKPLFYVYTTNTTIKIFKGTEITDLKTGELWVVTDPNEVSGGDFRYYTCYVEKKPAEKKP